MPTLSLQNPSRVALEDTHIGRLVLHSKGVLHFEQSGGSILDVDCPTPGAENPFRGTVSLKRVFLPRDRKHYLLRGPQPYRNVRYHLKSIENTQMANLFHSAELVVEREDDTWTNRAISRLYECFSDFGSSALRPVLWLLLLAGISFATTYAYEGATIAQDEKLFVGWKAVFLRSDCIGDLFRSLYLALQPIANPLGAFAKEPLLIARTPGLAVWLSVQGIVSVVLIALAIFAVRRRFKIS